MNRARLANVVVALSTTGGTAAADHDWKDGCPTYDDAPLPVSGRFGLSPEPDTALGPSRVALQYDAAQMSVPIDPTTGAALNHSVAQPWTQVGQVVGQLNLRQGPTVTFHYGAVTAADMRHLGNAGGALGYHYTDFSFDNALRWGLAFRLGEDTSLTAGDCQLNSRSRECVTASGAARDQHHDDLLLATIRSPFYPRWFGFDRMVSAVAEARVELTGCHSPFIHLRAEVNRWRTVPFQAMPVPLNTAPIVLAVPITVTAGAYVSPSWGAAGEIGFELRSPTSVLRAHRVARARALVDVRIGSGDRWSGLQWVHVTAYAGVVTGDAQGVVLGATLSFQFHGDAYRHDADIEDVL